MRPHRWSSDALEDIVDFFVGGELTDIGHRRERGGDLSSALRFFDEAVRRRPDDAKAWYNYGDTLLALGRTAQAIDPLREAVRLEPHARLYHYDLGLALQRLDRLEEAETHLRAAVADDQLSRAQSSLDMNALMSLAVCVGDQGRWQEAFATLATAETLAVSLIYNLARIRLHGGAPDDALRYFMAAAHLAPNDEEILHGAGTACLELGRAAEAEQFLARATAADPSCASAWYDRGCNLARQRDPRARGHFEACLARDPGYAWAHYAIACLDALEGRHDEAFERLERAVEAGFVAVKHARADADLTALHHDPRWPRLLERMDDARRRGRESTA